MTVNLSAGVIDHVVNGQGNPADTSMIGVPIYLAEYRPCNTERQHLGRHS